MRLMDTLSVASECKCWAAISTGELSLWSSWDCWCLWATMIWHYISGLLDCCRVQNRGLWSKTARHTAQGMEKEKLLKDRKEFIKNVADVIVWLRRVTKAFHVSHLLLVEPQRRRVWVGWVSVDVVQLRRCVQSLEILFVVIVVRNYVWIVLLVCWCQFH